MPFGITTENEDSDEEEQSNVSNNDVSLFYHPLTRRTGSRLADYLGVDGFESHSGVDYEQVIRWGCRRSLDTDADVLNPRGQIANASNKWNALQTFIESGDVRIPPTSRRESDIGPASDDETDLTWPVLSRSQSHAGGSDINLVHQHRDLEIDPERSGHHYVEYIPAAAEYRVHVVDGDVLVYHEKRLRSEEDVEQTHVRNTEAGWVFVEPRIELDDMQLNMAVDAVDELGLDFGAVDCILGEDGLLYVLEVNTAPTLDEPNLIRWGDRLANIVGIGESNVAGMSNVDWEEYEQNDE